jgi:hypothetical protein
MAIRRGSYIQWTAAPPPVPTQALRLIQRLTPLSGVVCAATVVVTLFATFYWVGSPYGWGICPTFSSSAEKQAREPVHFTECLYFSVVTIATLGYGDYRPVSWGRLIASVETLLGLVLAGVGVSRLVSQRQERMALRLLKAATNTEIQRFRKQLGERLDDLQATPLSLTVDKESKLLHRVCGLVKAIAKYWRHESTSPDLKHYANTKAARRLEGDLGLLVGLLDGAVERAQGTLVHPKDGVRLQAIVDSVQAVFEVIGERVIHPASRNEPAHARLEQFRARVRALRQQH